jgi:hypothetical protein
MDSQRKEINRLLKKGVFTVVTDSDVLQGVRIFNLRFINEIKHPSTNKAFKKSRLVIQAYNNQGKDLVLTQSPIIQRVSQRIILALTPGLQQATRSILASELYRLAHGFDIGAAIKSTIQRIL